MQLDHLLDLEGGDVLASPPDRVGRPADEVDVPLGVSPDEVAGVEPEVAPGRERRLGLAVVAVGDERWLVGAHDELADLAARHLDGPASSTTATSYWRRWRGRSCPGGEVRRAAGRWARRHRSSRRPRPGADRSAPRTPARTRGRARPTPAGPGGRRRRVAGGRLCSIVSVAPMKSKTVAPNRRTSSQKPDAEKRSPMAAVVPSTSAGITVSTLASRWNSGNGRVEDVVRRAARSARSSARPGARRSGGRARSPSTDRSCPEVNSTIAGSVTVWVGDRAVRAPTPVEPASDAWSITSTPASCRAVADPSVAPTTTARSRPAALGDDRAERGRQRVVDDDQPGRRQVERVGERRTSQRGVDQRRHRAQPAQRQPGDHEVGAVGQEDGHQLAARRRPARPGPRPARRRGDRSRRRSGRRRAKRRNTRSGTAAAWAARSASMVGTAGGRASEGRPLIRRVLLSSPRDEPAFAIDRAQHPGRGRRPDAWR